VKVNHERHNVDHTEHVYDNSEEKKAETVGALAARVVLVVPAKCANLLARIVLGEAVTEEVEEQTENEIDSKDEPPRNQHHWTTMTTTPTRRRRRRRRTQSNHGSIMQMTMPTC
jgi:hypothetical protein